ncbi:HlyD family efflux transporter periplasmic adaptor subunit [Marinobacter litoralis]|uniref:HlyD family efflux transporter periplasmic adaptor subunit n=1 Tax=Marinobacter litoralis TaxID=187981 RepID=UPI0018EB8654|nr:HlyD family efflux transporter periplasmic adaptor subunit [Marinobacter litoralis]MBJ6138912.1 HlyD family efflux transporter periplasmic adaptor subunit [Marinobacter litoralis]
MALLNITIDREMRAARLLLWCCVLTVVTFIGWAWWATLDDVTRGEGRVVPSGRLQSIQSLDGGLLSHLLVSEGDEVAVGQTLMVLDETRYLAAYRETEEQIHVLIAAIARLEAEVSGAQTISFPDQYSLTTSLMETEQELFFARQGRLKEMLNSFAEKKALAVKQLKLLTPLRQSQAVSEIELIQVQRDIAALQGEMLGVSRSYSEDAYGELVQKKGELSRLLQVAAQRSDQLQRTRVTSPVRGKVNTINVTTAGAVIGQGELIMDIMPLDDTLLVETRIKPRDVAFLAPGMPATIKLTAYDFSVYGSVEGKVIKISADSIQEETIRGKESFYRVLVSLDREFLGTVRQGLPIKPGMMAEVDIKTGERSIISYLLNPIIKARLI